MTVLSHESSRKQAKSVSFEVALAETGFGRFNYFVIIICGIIIINTVLEVIGISYILSIAECDLNFSQQEKSALSSISFVGIICSSHSWGFLADTLGRRKIMIPSLSIAFLITILSSFSLNFTMLVILRFLNGIFVCGGSATVFAYLSEFHGNHKRNKAIMTASFISAITAISFPFVAWLIINQDWKFPIEFLGIIYKPWRLYMITCGIYGLVGVFCLAKCFESPKFLLCIGKEEESLEVLRKIFAINTGNSADQYPVFQLEREQSKIAHDVIVNEETSKSILLFPKFMWQQTAPLFSKKFIRNTGLLCFMQFCTFLSAHGMRMWMPEILNSIQIYLERDNVTLSATVCYIVEYERRLVGSQVNKSIGSARIDKLEFGTIKYSVIFESIYPIVFLLVASGVKVFGRIKIIFLVLMICGVCAILSTTINIPIIGIFLYLIQLLVGIGVTLINSLSVELFPTHLKSMAVSLALMFGRLGSVFGSNMSGLLMPNNCKSAFIGSGSMLILSALFSLLLPKPEKTVLPIKTQEPPEDHDKSEIYITKF